ncbi:MAG TPA: carboxymuconolactone decarboxylase family protein, partial [Candidatus Binatia bacterium]|nr:carboxymuconolactone decarboxylase family protein [Candidatus Binatia bacterium]
MSSDALAPPGGWLESAARIGVPPAARRGWVLRAMSLAARRFGRSELPDVLWVFHLNPRLFWPWLLFASRLMPGGRLPAQERELVILRTAWNCRSRYEWGQHVEIGLRVGLADADIVRAARAPQSFEQERRRLLLAACDELVRDKLIGETTWRALAAHFNPRLLIEIV